MISRRTFIHGACGYVLGVLSVGSYSRFLEPRWVEIKNVVIGINNLPKRFGGMSIVQLSDIHHCEYVPREFIRKCVWKVNTLSPDIIVLTGDFVYGSNAFIPSVAEELSELKSKEGVHVLINEHIPLYRKKDYLFIAGVDDLWRGNMDLDATLKGMDDKPKILLSHNPDAIEMIKHTGIDFVMAGHTHGGQVCLPLYGPPVVYSKFGARYAAGLFHEEKTIMYVNKGIGVSNFPVRFFARPEITLFTLQNSLQSV